MKKRGFTLIELLAVIVILAVIAVITIPLINDIIEKSRMEAFRDTGYGLVESAHIYFAKNLENTTDKIFEFPNNYDGLQFKGEVPKGGTLEINGKKTQLFVYNSKYCASKGFTTDIVSVGKLETQADGSVIGCDVKLTEETNCIQPTIQVNPSNDTWSNKKEVTIIHNTTSKCDVKEYRINGGEWKNYTNSITLNDNASVEARTLSSDNSLQTSPVAKLEVKKIDTVKPNATIGFNKQQTSLGLSINATDYAQNSASESGINNDSYLIKLGDTKISEKTNEASVNLDLSKENVINYEVSDNASNKYNGSVKISGNSSTSGYCAVPVVTIDKTGWQHDKTATLEFSDCDTHEYSTDGSTWTSYTTPLNFTQNTTLMVRSSSNDSSVASTTITVYIDQIDGVSPFTPILSSYSTRAKSIDDFGFECSTDNTSTTSKQKCAIWVNCKEGIVNENGNTVCEIPFDYSTKDNDGGSGVTENKFKYKFTMSDGSVVNSSDEWSTTFNTGETITKDISIYNIKLADLVGNESEELELKIYWHATEKGSLEEATQPGYNVGDVVYFDPVSENTCTKDTFSKSNVISGTSTCYRWRVIKDNNSDITIQLDHNIGDGVYWISRADYNDDANFGHSTTTDVVTPNGNCTISTGLYYGNTDKGPITILKALANRTSSWTRVNLLNYEYNSATYGKLSCTNGVCSTIKDNNATVIAGSTTPLRARFITGEEVAEVTNTVAEEGAISKTWSETPAQYCFACQRKRIGTNTTIAKGEPDAADTLAWLIENTDTFTNYSTANEYGDATPGYWTLSSRNYAYKRSGNSSTYIWQVRYNGQVVAQTSADHEHCLVPDVGVRPVITIEKSKASYSGVE
ncbi:MAG: type II secretion system protein [Bacilli bacterium]|nr:type II secretion system protein [Bacilli bacterium]